MEKDIQSKEVNKKKRSKESKGNKIVIVCGPTASGKTTAAIELAKSLDGEIVSSDSMQIYKYMNIGSAKPTKEERKEAVHHLIDFVDPREDFSVAKYKKIAEKKIDDIISQGKLPIIAGGTGLYVNSIIYDMDFAASNEGNSELRKKLYEELELYGRDYLYEKLQDIDEEASKRIHRNNVIKVIRAIESAKLGNKIKDFSKELQKNPKYDPIIISINRDRKELYDRINLRVDLLIEEGLIEEVEGLMNKGLTEQNISMKGIGYKEVINYLRGKVSKEEAIEQIKRNTRRYAKRQMTWFRKYEDAYILNLSEEDRGNEKIEDLKQWMKNQL